MEQQVRTRVYKKNVLLFKDEDVKRSNGEVYTPNLMGLDKLRRTDQFRRGVSFQSNMSDTDVGNTLQRVFTELRTKRFFCATSTIGRSARLNFDGERRVWDGATIKRNAKGNRCLYVVPDVEKSGCKRKAGESGYSSEEVASVASADPSNSGTALREVTIDPGVGPIKGGTPVILRNLPQLDCEFLVVAFRRTEVEATRQRKGDGWFLTTPKWDKPETVPVIIMKPDGNEVGQTEFIYTEDETDAVLMSLLNDNQLKKSAFCDLMDKWVSEDQGSGGIASNHFTSFGPPKQGGQLQSVEILRRMLYIAARIGRVDFIQTVFNTSADRVVFGSYKDRSTLPEHIAEANNHDAIAAYLRQVTERFSTKEESTETQSSHVNWRELARAFEEREKECGLTEAKWRKPMEDDASETYFGDTEVSDSDKERSDSDSEFERIYGNVPLEIRARGRLALEAYTNALREGRTRFRRIPVMLIGQERSGKTSLKRSLLGAFLNPYEDITVEVHKEPSHFRVTTEICTAENSDTARSYHDLAAKLFVNLTKIRKEEGKEGRPSRSICICNVDSKETKNALPLGSALSLELLSSTPKAPDEIVATQACDVPRPDNDQNVLDDIAAPVASLFFKTNMEEKEKEQGISLGLWDFGGQSVYYVTNPLFLTPKAIYLMVFDLSRHPHDVTHPPVKQGVFTTSKNNFIPSTNLDYLNFWMASVASLASPGEDLPAHGNPKSEVLPNRVPPVILVCTHADQPYGGANPRAEALKIYSLLSSKPYKTQLYNDVFVVDNTNRECSEVIRLWEAIVAVAKDLPQVKEHIPIKWLKYEKALQVAKNEGCRWISIDKAREIASLECQIVPYQEFTTLLNFLHDQRILIHFDDSPALNNMVVLDPQWLIDVFKKAITVPPFQIRERGFIELWRKLENEGILTDELLQHVWGPLLGQQQISESLIAIMEKFCLLCPWPTSDASCSKQYLVPSMLMSAPQEKVINLAANAQIPSLFLQFESGHVPPGLFPRLMLQIFQWGKDEFCSTKPQLYHNFARFYTKEDDCSVIFLCHSLSIEAVIHGGSLGGRRKVAEGAQSKLNTTADDAACARALHRQLDLILECMREQFSWMKNMRYKIGVICPVCCQGDVVKYCRTHCRRDCKREECLHIWTEPELRGAKTFISCTRSATTRNNHINVNQLSVWFPSQGKQASHQAIDESERRLFPFDEGNEDASLALPESVVEALLSQSCEPNEIVLQLTESLQLDHAALEQPEPGTKRLIRDLASKAKQSNRLDVVKHLRCITPAGTTGPLLSGQLDIRNVPVRQMTELTSDLSCGEEWKDVAERLGLTPNEIRFLDKRVMNPCDAVLAFVSRQRCITVEDLYDVLNECGLPVMADVL